jgi:alkylation response protein AidB-like acyl-CoA dehydrogenase
MRASGLSDLVLTDVAVGPDDRFAPGDTDPLLDLARLGLAAISVGIARGATENATRYARERTQFGREISRFGAIRFHLAEMTADLFTARSLVHDAARQIDQGDQAGISVAVARLRAGEAAVRAADRTVQVLGGYGYVSEFPAERFYRDAQVPRSLLTRDDQERARIADLLLG